MAEQIGGGMPAVDAQAAWDQEIEGEFRSRMTRLRAAEADARRLLHGRRASLKAALKQERTARMAFYLRLETGSHAEVVQLGAALEIATLARQQARSLLQAAAQTRLRAEAELLAAIASWNRPCPLFDRPKKGAKS